MLPADNIWHNMMQTDSNQKTSGNKNMYCNVPIRQNIMVSDIIQTTTDPALVFLIFKMDIIAN